MDFVAEAVLALVSGALAGAGMTLFLRRHRVPSFGALIDAGEHEHEFNHMLRDGVWRCGICKAPRPKETP